VEQIGFAFDNDQNLRSHADQSAAVGLVYEMKPDQVRKILAELERVLRAQPKHRVRFPTQAAHKIHDGRAQNGPPARSIRARTGEA
jgi:hypothetical protein